MDVKSGLCHAEPGSASKTEQKEGSPQGGFRMDFFCLDHFNNLPNHADALQISPQFDDDLCSKPLVLQILGGVSGQLIALAIGRAGCARYETSFAKRSWATTSCVLDRTQSLWQLA
jgi:hypothetical protein